MKRFVRCVCVLMVVAILFANPVFATESASARSSSFFMCSSVYLWKTSYTTFEAWFDVVAVDTMDQVGASIIKIQRSSDGVNWTTMKTYSKDDYPDMIYENSIGHVGCVSYTGAPGYYYRAYIVLYAKNSSGTGLMPEYTEPKRL